MNMIVAVDKNWGIGKNNQLMWHIPSDMRFFREKTMGHIVVMGRKTLESFPKGQPLKQRTNIVLSSNSNYKVKDALVLHTVEETLEYLKKYPSEDIFIIGGASIYRQFFPYCNKAYVTKIGHTFEADTYFPDLDKIPEWELTGRGKKYTENGLDIVFTIYEQREVFHV